MSFGGLILTNNGRNKMAAAISEKNALKFTHVQLGDGTFSGSYSSKTELSHKVMEIPITRIRRNDNEVLIECDWNSKQAPTAFYLREIGIIGNDVLCYYDNARNGDAEYIDPESEVVAKQKRFRFTISVTDDAEITTVISSGLYALAEDVEKSLSDLNKNKLDKTGDASDVTVTFVEAETRENISSGEKLYTLFGKISKFFSELKEVAFSGDYNDLKNKPTAKNVGAAPTSHASTETTYGVSTAASYGHAMAGSTTPKANGTASAGTETAKFARADHVHPLQESVEKLTTARTIDGVVFNGTAAIIHYGTCSTAAATAAKVVACTGFSLVTGATIRVKFTITNTASSPTLNVNNTGAKPIYYRGAAISAGYLAVNRTYEFAYNGTQYDFVGDINTDANTTYGNMTGATTTADGKAGLAPAPTAGTATRYLRSDGTWAVPPNTTYSKASSSKLGLVYLVDGVTSTSTESAATANTARELHQNSIYKNISRIGTTALSVSSIMSSQELIITLNCTDNNNNECEFTWTAITDWIPTTGKHFLSGYKTNNFEGLAEVVIDRSSAKIVNCIVGGTQFKTTATLRIYYRG
ncbi:MAG: phage tail protein [Lachnospiraceae bacterium]|nr:phage tail protein [Lachnospiraceae bacterium]